MIEHITEGGITYEVETVSLGYKRWHLNGKRHRVNGPAIEWADGTEFWYLNGKRHRVDGPAVEDADGYKSWYLNDKLHRVDGPAKEYAEGDKHWYLNNEVLTEEEFQEFHKAYKHIKKHPEEALRYMNHKHLGFVVREILEGICPSI